MNWAAPSSNGGSAITGYNWRFHNSAGTVLLTNSLNALTVSVTGLGPATTYYFSVSATNGAGTSAYTNSGNFTSLVALPGAPTGLTTSAIWPRSTTISWTAPSNNGGLS